MTQMNLANSCSLIRRTFSVFLSAFALCVHASVLDSAPAALAPAAPITADKASDDFNLAVGLYRSGRWQLAADTLQQFLTENPGHPRTAVARLYLGLSLSSMEKYAEAKGHFVNYLTADPDSPLSADARYRLGECSYHLRDYDAAVSQLSEFVDRHPEHALNSWARLFLGDCYNSLSQWVKAESMLRDLLKSPSADQVKRDAQFSLGVSFEGQNRVPDALLLYREVAADDNSSLAPRALAKIGTLNFNQGKFADAAESYDAIIRRFPNSTIVESARLNSGVACFRNGQFQEAVERLKSIPRDSPVAAQAFFITALSLRDLKNAEQARIGFADALAAAGDTPLAADILYQRAQFERVESQNATAAKIFEDIADRFSSDARVPESLFNAAEIYLDLNNVESAGRLWKRLAADFSQVAESARFQVLLGRILIAENDREQAVSVFHNVLKLTADLSPSDPDYRTHLIGRYYLVRTQFDLGNHAAVSEGTRPVLDELTKPGNIQLASMLALSAISSLETTEYPEARLFANTFLKVATDERQMADVIAVRCVASMHLKDFEAARTDATLLVEKYHDYPQTWTAILKAAERASDQRAYSEASGLFEMASRNMTDAGIRLAGLMGVAWSQFNLKEYSRAEKVFADIARQFPESKELPQVLYMQGRCMEEAGDLDRAAIQFQFTFMKLTADAVPAKPNAETEPPMQYAFDAGRQAARIFARFGNVEKADQIWDDLVKQFPVARNLDHLLEEWAWLNASEGRYEQSDKIYRQLLDRFPQSRFAGQARLSLAESELTAGRIDAASKEFAAIVAEPGYGSAEKETALFHLADIATTSLDWNRGKLLSQQFLAEYSASQLAAHARLFLAESLLKQNGAQETDFEQAANLLASLREDVISERLPAEPWHDRIWIVRAQAALLAKDYSDMDTIAAEFVVRSPESPLLFQIKDLQGRRWKNQAPPDFEKARDYFRQVISDKVGAKTETAAQCHFLLAETYVLEEKYDKALVEYFAIRFGYPYQIWQEQALYQAAACELQLNQKSGARKTLEELIRVFPDSQFVAPAKKRLDELASESP